MSGWAGTLCLRSPFVALSTALGLGGQSLALGKRSVRQCHNPQGSCSNSCQGGRWETGANVKACRPAGGVGLEGDQDSQLCNKLHYQNGCTAGCIAGTQQTAGNADTVSSHLSKDCSQRVLRSRGKYYWKISLWWWRHRLRIPRPSSITPGLSWDPCV